MRVCVYGCVCACAHMYVFFKNILCGGFFLYIYIFLVSLEHNNFIINLSLKINFTILIFKHNTD